jgi:4-hydroxy-tetrahydrodipicolinate synthase
VELCRNPSKSQAIQDFMSENMQLMHDTYPTSAKYVLQQMGFPIDLATRRNVGTLQVEQKEALDRLIEERKRRFT